jgi:polyphenol oxidase
MIKSSALDFQNIRHGFFTREGGHSAGIFSSLNCGLGSGDELEVVKKNRELVAAQLGVTPSHLVSAFQVHSADVVTVTAPFSERPKVDGLVTATRGLALGILTADCGPVLFADEKVGVIGACHAGWKGALNGVTDSTVLAMEALGSSRENIIAVLGPIISKANYEVGPEFPKPFLTQDESHRKYFMPSVKAGHYMFDLPAYLLSRLKMFGVGKAIDLALCTYADEQKFFSYRRATHRGETDYGRLISAIALT